MLLRLFLFFLKISSFTLGGGYAMVIVLERALLTRKWLSEEELFDIVSVAQALPGPVIFNTAFFVGRRLCGLPGAFVALLGVILPPFVAIIAASAFIIRFAHIAYVQYFLKGSYAAAIGLIAHMVYKTTKRQKWTILKAALLLAGIAAAVLWKQMLIPAFFIIAIVLYLGRENREETGGSHE